MGYEIERFTTEVDPEFMCSICTDVLQNPVMLPACEHFFCKACINIWWKNSNRCPLCNTIFNSITTPPRLLRVLMARLILGCPYAECTSLVTFDQLPGHEANCEHRPANRFWRGVKHAVNGFFSMFSVMRAPPPPTVDRVPADEFNFD